MSERQITRQQRWKEKQRANRRCIICGDPLGDSPYKTECLKHALMRREKMRERFGNRKWRLGSAGRPPFVE
jgi:ribosomal protein S14